jgi:hypothetical protein
MHAFWETVGVGLSVAIVFGTIGGFVALIRYFGYKEKEALRKYGLLDEKEFDHE